MSNPETTADPYENAPPLTHILFVTGAARLAQRSSSWAADAAMNISWGHDAEYGPIRRETVERYLKEMRELLEHIERQVKP